MQRTQRFGPRYGALGEVALLHCATALSPDARSVAPPHRADCTRLAFHDLASAWCADLGPGEHTGTATVGTCALTCGDAAWLVLPEATSDRSCAVGAHRLDLRVTRDVPGAHDAAWICDDALDPRNSGGW